MTDVMIDIETLSTKPNAVIVSIGAIKFDRKEPLKPLDEYEQLYIRVSRESGELVGMDIDHSTVEWWGRQKEDIRYEALENPTDRLDIKDALKKLSKWFKGSKYIWGHGDDFDCVILTQAYMICGQPVPWKFWNTRDTRTIFDIAGITNRDLPTNEKHHPIHDCYRQLTGLRMAFDNITI